MLTHENVQRAPFPNARRRPLDAHTVPLPLEIAVPTQDPNALPYTDTSRR
ncbi:MAG: hypothetical protein N2055_03685 [Tepidimonas taiwanensis]|nr:hypothetical protein [Tepidimonas taiwanensis]